MCYYTRSGGEALVNTAINNPSYIKNIKKCPLFDGMSLEELEAALDFFGGEIRCYRKGDFIQTVLAPFSRFGLVLSGEAMVYMDDIDGDNMIMANVSAGDTFGESLCLLGSESPVYVQAMTDVTLLALSTAGLYSSDGDHEKRHAYLLRFSSMLAKRALAMNDRIQVLSNITLREKIITFLSQYRSKLSSYEFSIPFDRASMAVYLGTDRASLSRELSKMKSDGIIDYKKNQFIIKK